MELMKVLLFAGAVSLDGFIAGMACGVRLIRIPFLSQLVIVLASGLAVLCSMLAGKGLAHFIGIETAVTAGAALLLCMAVFFALQGWREYLCARCSSCSEPLLMFQVRPLGVIIQVLQSPEEADKDASGEISWQEAGVLGFALALDSFGAGVGIALGGFSVPLTVLVVCCISFVAMKWGLKAGRKVGQKSGRSTTSFVTSLIFLLLAAVQLVG